MPFNSIKEHLLKLIIISLVAVSDVSYQRENIKGGCVKKIIILCSLA